MLHADNAPHSGAIGDDIAKILQDVKLPERQSFKALADKPVVSASAVERPTSEPAIAVPTPPKQSSIVNALHTLKDDMQDILQIQKMSIVRASALEQDKKRSLPKKAPPSPGVQQRSRRVFGIAFVILLLCGLGGAALYGVAVVTTNHAVTPTQQYPSMLFTEQTVTLPIDNATAQSIKETIAQARNQSNVPIGSIMRIVPTVTVRDTRGITTTRPATISEFFTSTGMHTPSGLVRGLGDDFFLGIHTVDINAPVFVIPVLSYDLAFAGMLAWEPFLSQDLAPAFDPVPALTTGADGLPVTRTFTDTVVLNYDVRALKDDTGQTSLYYSFPTPHILIIGESLHTFTEVLSRLQAQRKL
jgi:hypothetical protein